MSVLTDLDALNMNICMFSVFNPLSHQHSPPPPKKKKKKKKKKKNKKQKQKKKTNKV